MRAPGGILINSSTGIFHPVIFRPAPLPSEDLSATAIRHKSSAHHTDGFRTLEEAIEWFSSDQGTRIGAIDEGVRWDWDGNGVPALVYWFASPLARD